MSTDLVLVLPGLERSGGYRTLCEWANRAAAEGRRTAVVSPTHGPGASYLSPEVEVRVCQGGRRHAVGAAVRLTRPLGREPELLVYPRAVRSLIGDAEQVVLGFVPWQQTLRRPVIRYCQHWEPVWFSEGSRARRRAEKAMSLPGTTVVNSTWLENQFPAPRRPFLSKVFPGVDLGVFRPDGPTSSAALPPRAAGMLRVVSLGRADVPWKGGGELRQALAEGLPPLELCLFGTPDVAEARHPWGLERRLGQLGTADLATLLRSADLVVSPSWYESFPLPPLEAMACGAPVLTTREGTEDYAVHDVNAFVVPGRDSSALNAALRQLLDDLSLRQQLAQAGSRTAQQFSWDNGFKQFRRAMSWD